MQKGVKSCCSFAVSVNKRMQRTLQSRSVAVRGGVSKVASATRALSISSKSSALPRWNRVLFYPHSPLRLSSVVFPGAYLPYRRHTDLSGIISRSLSQMPSESCSAHCRFALVWGLIRTRTNRPRTCARFVLKVVRIHENL